MSACRSSSWCGRCRARRGVDEGVIAHRLSGTWMPRAESFTALVAAETRDADVSRPYPFFLAYALEGELEALGDPTRVAGRVEVGRDPGAGDPARRADVHLVARRGARDGTLSGARRRRGFSARRHRARRRDHAVEGREPLPFAQLQRRIGRKTLGGDPERRARRADRVRPAGSGTAATCVASRSARRRGELLATIGAARSGRVRAVAGGDVGESGRSARAAHAERA